MNTTLGLIAVGLVAGALSGMVGIGGGVVVIPALVFLFGFGQAMAQGTTLAMLLPPIGVLAVLSYAKNHNVDWKVAGLLCLGFLLGGYFGAEWANKVDGVTVRKVFAVFLFLVSLKMFFS